MTRIATAMISAGYGTECCQVYNIARRNEFNEALKNLGFDTISIDDVQRMQWEPLNLVRSMVIQLLTFADVVVLTNQISSPARGATAEKEEEQLAANFSSLRTLHLISRQERGESA
ncbi:hypothetical protein U1Q18_021268 [Sarracenia purpurea var. burkii]